MKLSFDGLGAAGNYRWVGMGYADQRDLDA
jgi:hypothetical protein